MIGRSQAQPALACARNVAVDVLNLFDTKNNDIEYFYTSRLPGEPLQGVDDFHVHPAEPRTGPRFSYLQVLMLSRRVVARSEP